MGVRPRRFGIPYRMLSSASEAEDLVQDVWLRWQGTDRSVVVNPAAFLATTTTRLAINALQSARVRRETYVGPWLPEPVDTSADPYLGAERGEAIRDRLLTNFDRASTLEPGPLRSRLLTVTFVGGGFSGVEGFGELLSLGAALVRKYPELDPGELRFHLVEARDRILPEVTDGPGRWVVRSLRKRGARVHLNAQLTSAADGHVVLSTGEEFDSDLIVWTVGNAVNPVVRCSAVTSSRWPPCRTRGGRSSAAANRNMPDQHDEAVQALAEVWRSGGDVNAGAALVCDGGDLTDVPRGPGAAVTVESVNGRAGLAVRRDGRVVAVIAVRTAAGRVEELWIVLNPAKLRHWR
ncbi:MAG: FAD-dependent oxidoreductase [Actinoplanes sp.]